MAIHDAGSQRLFVDADLGPGVRIECTAEQATYLRAVLRAAHGAEVRVFNGRDGEWQAVLHHAGKRGVDLSVTAQLRQQDAGPDVRYLFAPLKRARLDYMVQKAAEMGVARLSPVLTRHTIADRVNLDRMRANVIEAAEQCGILHIPIVDAPVPLAQAIATFDPHTALVFCDEEAPRIGPLGLLAALKPGPTAVLVGPEGGFSQDERRLLLSQPFVIPLSLGSRIVRADTAAVAVLALINATRGDWTTPTTPSA